MEGFVLRMKIAACLLACCLLATGCARLYPPAMVAVTDPAVTTAPLAPSTMPTSVATPPVAPSSPVVIDTSVDLLMTYVTSGQWRADLVAMAQDEDYAVFEINLAEIVDVDGDGVSELLLESRRDPEGPTQVVTGLYTVANGAVVYLMMAEMSGGSIGGETIFFAHDTQENEPVIGVGVYAGGFGGRHIGYRYYNYQGGQASQLIVFSSLVYNDDSEPAVYEKDWAASTQEEFESLEARFVEPIFSEEAVVRYQPQP